MTDPLSELHHITPAPWPEHPEDDWVDVTPLGATAPQVIRGFSYIARTINQAATAYIEGAIPFEEFERRVDTVIAETEAP